MVGDKVIMNDKYYVSEADKNKIFIIASEPWECCGTMVVKLDGRSGGYAVDGLTLIEKQTNTEEIEETLSQIDDVVNDLGKIIIEIAEHNEDFICTTCLDTAKELYQIFKQIARDEDCGSLCEQYLSITGRDLDE